MKQKNGVNGWRNEAERTAGTRIEPGGSYGFFTDTTLCIGCKACEVACKEWNQLPAEATALTGLSYDNTRTLPAPTWRHLTFLEQMPGDGGRSDRHPPPPSRRPIITT